MTPVTVDPDDSRGKIESMQWPLVEDREGRLWVGSDTDKGLYLLDRKTDRFTRYDSKITVRVLAMGPLVQYGWVAIRGRLPRLIL